MAADFRGLEADEALLRNASARTLALTLGAFLVYLALLGATGLGFEGLLNVLSGVPPVADFLQEKVDPAWGNAAIALLAVELSAPLLIAATLAATPAATANLQAQLTEWNLDAEGLNARIEEVLEKTTD